MSFILHELHSITKIKKPVDLNYVKILEGFFCSIYGDLIEVNWVDKLC